MRARGTKRAGSISNDSSKTWFVNAMISSLVIMIHTFLHTKTAQMPPNAKLFFTSTRTSRASGVFMTWRIPAQSGLTFSRLRVG